MTPLEVADRLLEVVGAAFTAAAEQEPGYDPAKPPHSRRYVSDGGVVFDWTPIIAVEWEATEPAFTGEGGESPGGSPAAMGGGFLALRDIFTIHVTRLSPWPDEVGTPPQPPKIRASATKVFGDAKLVIDTLVAGFADSSLLGVCGKADFIRQSAVGPDGGVVGSATVIGVQR